MTELSSSSLVSTISGGSSSSVHRPRPPNAPRPSTKPFTARRSKIVQSPYLATSTPKKVTSTEQRDKWAQLSSAWSPTFNSEALTQTLMKLPGNSLMLASSISKKRKRSSSTAVTHLHGAGEEISRDDLQEELHSVKRELQSACRERDLGQARLRRAEEEIGQKDKQIEQLLASGVISSSDALRVAGGGKADAFISSLRLKVHTLQMALREKEREVSSLHQDIRYTRLKEHEVATEVYYQEVCRLQKLLEQLHAEYRGPSPISYREVQAKAQVLEEGVARLSQQLEGAESDNKRLREELERALERPTQWTGHSEKGYRGSIADKYADLDRAKMLSAIVDLELRAQESSKTIQSLCREFDDKKASYEGRLAEANSKHAEAVQTLDDLVEKGRRAEEVQEKLRGTIKKLKEDRTHYRSLAEQTQAQLVTASEQLQKMEVAHNSTLKELASLHLAHQDELLAREHAQKLASHRSTILTSTRTRQEEAAATIQRYWRRRRAQVKQGIFQASLGRAVLDIQSALRGHVTRRRALEVALLPPSAPSSSPDTLTSASSEGLSEEADSNEEIDGGGGSDGGGGKSDGGGGGRESDVSAEVQVVQCALRAYQSRRMAMLDLTTTFPSGEDISESYSSEVTSSDEAASSSVMSALHSSGHMHSSASCCMATPLNEPHPPDPVCPSPQELPMPHLPPHPQGLAFLSHQPHPLDQAQPSNTPHPLEETHPSREPHPLDQAHPASEPHPPIKGVEAWRTFDDLGGVPAVTSSLVECTSPPPRPHPTEGPCEGPSQPSLKISHAGRRCWVRSAEKGSLHSRSLVAIGSGKLHLDRPASTHQLAAADSSSSDMEGRVSDTPERVLLAEELS